MDEIEKLDEIRKWTNPKNISRQSISGSPIDHQFCDKVTDVGLC